MYFRDLLELGKSYSLKLGDDIHIPAQLDDSLNPLIPPAILRGAAILVH